MKKSMLIVTLLCAAVGVAQAIPVDVTFVKSNPYKDVKVVNPFSSSTTYRVGLMEFAIDLNDGNGAQTAYGFCVDLKQNASYNAKPYELQVLEAAPQDHNSGYGPMGVTKANYIRELWAAQFANVAGNAVNAAAFQVAIWEIIYEDGDWDAASGDLYSTNSTVASQANAFLGALTGQGALEPTLMALTCDLGPTSFQDYVISFSGGERPPVPEPLTMATALLGLCGLGGYIRRRTVA